MLYASINSVSCHLLLHARYYLAGHDTINSVVAGFALTSYSRLVFTSLVLRSICAILVGVLHANSGFAAVAKRISIMQLHLGLNAGVSSACVSHLAKGSQALSVVYSSYLCNTTLLAL